MKQFNVARDFPDTSIPQIFIPETPMSARDVLRIDLFAALYSTGAMPHNTNDLEALEVLSAFQSITKANTFASLRALTVGDGALAAYAADALVLSLASEDVFTVTRGRLERAVDSAFVWTMNALRVVTATGTKAWVESLPDAERLEVLRIAASNATLDEYARLLAGWKHLGGVAQSVDPAGGAVGRSEELAGVVARNVSDAMTRNGDSDGWVAEFLAGLDGLDAAGSGTASGGFVIVLDEASSIGSRDMQKARAFAVLLCEIANSRGARARVITCSAGKVRHHVPIDGRDRSGLFGFIRHRQFGAPALNEGLEAAVELIQDGDRVVVITDHRKHQVASQVWAEAREAGVASTGVLLEGPGMSTLQLYVDDVVHI